MLTLKTAIEKINEYEEENYKLQEQIEFFQRKSQRLKKRNKEIYDGFMATTQELCDKSKEIERLNNIIDELESYLEQQYLEWKDCETDVKFMAHEDKAILDKLKELKGGKNENISSLRRKSSSNNTIKKIRT